MLAVTETSPDGVSTGIAAIAPRTVSAARRDISSSAARQQDDEFLAAEAANEVELGAHGPRQRPSNRLKNLIAGAMAVDVVDVLEMVEIDDQQRRRRAAAHRYRRGRVRRRRERRDGWRVR